ncbi:MAG: DUF6785 family protein [Armatimonadota bacterium]|nr:DUF6785 family protein [Armatimonadota bacterium]
MMATQDPAHEQRTSQSPASGALCGLTWRAVLIGVAASVFLGDWTQYAELIIHGTQLSFTFPPIGGFFVFLCIYLLFNVVLRAVHRPLTLSTPELVLIFTMTVMASGIASQGLAQIMLPMIAGPFYYASPENGWEELLLRHVPEWMAPRDPFVIRGLFEAWPFGVPWREWLVPLLAWTALVLASYTVMMSLLTLFRRQWIERERLLFPLIVLPVRVVETPDAGRVLNSFLRNPYTWIGAAIAFGIHFYNGLHGYYPHLPVIEVCQLGGRRVPTWGWGTPWNALGTLRFAAMPMIVGLSFLLTREVAFSLWALYWLGEAEAVAGSALGIDGITTAAGGDTWPFPGHQTAGAYLALAAVSVWIARRPLARLVRRGLALRPVEGEQREPLSFRSAAWSGLIAFIFILGWSSYAGTPALVALLVWSVVFAYALAMTRLLAEGGMPWLDHPYWAAQDIVRAVVPYRAMPMRSWASVSMLTATVYHLRVTPMPRMMQSLKLAHETRTGNRAITWSLAIATVAAIPVSYYFLLGAGYVHGGVAINPARFVTLARYPGVYMERVTTTALRETDWISLAIMGYAALKLALLSFLRIRFVWWPLHPVAYAMSFNVYVIREWLSVLIGWLCQTVAMRYGGYRAVQRYRPFFLGLILGAMLVSGVWLIVDGVTGLRDHKILY